MNKISGRDWMYQRKFAIEEFNWDFIDGLDKLINFALQHPLERMVQKLDIHVHVVIQNIFSHGYSEGV